VLLQASLTGTATSSAITAATTTSAAASTTGGVATTTTSTLPTLPLPLPLPCLNRAGWVRVKWAVSGAENSYRWGAKDKYDLKVCVIYTLVQFSLLSCFSKNA
jgi:hypothetical protein